MIKKTLNKIYLKKILSGESKKAPPNMSKEEKRKFLSGKSN
tara:strand:+ start:801 stop:923 length:123 start_codon:yes stop_codon:yes gene_type:complete